MENLELKKLFNSVYKDKSVFITGHTGFKGSWLSLFLHLLGAKVTGYALDPAYSPNHFDSLNLEIRDIRKDIRDLESLKKALYLTKPDIVFHLAAQPIVRTSYINPLETWDVNVMGTLHLLEACREIKPQAIVVVTTDKVYENQEKKVAYKESDRLGGHDPYSASKTACEILVESYRKSFFQAEDSPKLSSARAGNVIGGGDFSPDRLIPDIVRSLSRSKTLEIRSPFSTRPWQHVLDCLSGYLLLGERLLEKREAAAAWNFGPSLQDNRQVLEVLEKLQSKWQNLNWEEQKGSFHEANLLHLDSSSAKEKLGWKPVWNLDEALQHTSEWYESFMKSEKPISEMQIKRYVEDALKKEASWAL